VSLFFFPRYPPYLTPRPKPLQSSMPDPERLENENSENGSTGYSDFCDDDAILAVDETLIDAPQDHFKHAAQESPSSATIRSPTSTSGKRKSPDDFVQSDRDGPFASYRRRTISGLCSIDSLESSPSHPSSSADSGPGGNLPFIIVRLQKISEHFISLISYQTWPGTQWDCQAGHGCTRASMGRPMGDRAADFSWALFLEGHYHGRARPHQD
jgi:hypothetical protein